MHLESGETKLLSCFYQTILAFAGNISLLTCVNSSYENIKTLRSQHEVKIQN